jgi:hypothetical protein
METVPGQGDNWEAWSCNDYGPESVYVSDEQANSGTQSVKIDEADGADIVLAVGPYTSNIYEISWKMYIPSGSGGYFNLMHEWGCNGSGAEWACDIYFSDSGEISWTLGGTDGELTLPFAHDVWFDVVCSIDLDSDQATIGIASNPALQWQWSLNNADGTVGMNQLETVNFYGFSTEGSADGLYYIDDVSIVETITVDLAEEDKEAVQLYPNPAVDITRLSGIKAGSIVKVFDLSGKEMIYLNATSNTVDLNTHTLESGIYLVTILSDEALLTKKLVVRN